MSDRELVTFLLGAVFALAIRGVNSALIRYWCYTRPLKKIMRERAARIESQSHG